ncbi:hypothetical protein ACOMHN_015613 [Nucella lapillus]
MKCVESESGLECEEKEIGDSYCTDGPTGPEGGDVSSEGTNEEGGEGEGDRGLVDGGREVENECSDSTTPVNSVSTVRSVSTQTPSQAPGVAVYNVTCVQEPPTDPEDAHKAGPDQTPPSSVCLGRLDVSEALSNPTIPISYLSSSRGARM